MFETPNQIIGYQPKRVCKLNFTFGSGTGCNGRGARSFMPRQDKFKGQHRGLYEFLCGSSYAVLEERQQLLRSNRLLEKVNFRVLDIS